MTNCKQRQAVQNLQRGFDYLKFMAAGLPSFILAIPLNYMLVEWAALPKSPAYALVLAFQVTVNFFMLRRFVFKERTGRSLLTDFAAFFSGIMLFRLADFLLYSALVYYAGTWLCALVGPQYYIGIQLANVVIFSVLKFLFAERLFLPGDRPGAPILSRPDVKLCLKLAAGLCLLAGIAAAGVASAGVVALAAKAEGTWAQIVCAIRPIYFYAAAGAGWLAWYVLACGIHNSLADWIRFAARMLFMVGALFAGIVLLLIYKGGAPWAFIFYADKPIHDLAISAACFLGWYILARGIHNNRQAWALFSARMILLIVSLGLTLLAAEIGIRFYLDKYCRENSFEYWKKLCAEGKTMPLRTTHPMSIIIRPCENRRLVYELQPGLNLDFGHRRLKTNSAGMRCSKEYALERLPHSIRILGIGDSGMFGWDQEQDDNYMDVLERNLNERHDSVTYEALNLAVPGYNTQLEVETLRTKGLAYKPDIVIVGWCNNDYGLPFFLIQQTDFRRRDHSFVNLLIFDRNRLREIMEPVQFRELRKYDAKSVLPEIADGTNIEGVRQAMRELKQLSSQHGFRLLVLGPMDGNCVKICQAEAIPYFNTRERIPGDKYPKEYSVHFMHPAKGGHAVLAKELEQYLDKQGWLQPKLD
ncbi:MAG: GDSL-type esterase/lipase family protein [Kiritimatiellaeota bacterium]|nr:GDSL-type esterase/lipase family protein [Kiritimatiellota bacterium]